MSTFDQAECGPDDCGPGGMGLGPMARYGPWLVLVWAPLLLATEMIPAVLEDRWLEAALCLVIATVYVLAIVTHHRGWRGRAAGSTPLVLVTVQGVLTGLAVVLAQDSGSVFLLPLLVAIAVSVVAPPRQAPALIGVVTLLSGAVALIAGWEAGLVAWLVVTTLLSGLGTFAMFRMGATVEELNRTRRELADAAVTAERMRFSRDLHDLLGHTLSVIVVKAEAIRRTAEADPAAASVHAAEIEQLGRSALVEVREAVAGYREGSLADELSRSAAALRAGGVYADVAPAPDDLDAATQSLLGWVVREGVTNVLRHADASRCRITVGFDGTRASVAVRDDGSGPGEIHAGSGLTGLAERVREHGGELSAGRNGTGFELRAEVPVGAGAGAPR